MIADSTKFFTRLFFFILFVEFCIFGNLVTKSNLCESGDALCRNFLANITFVFSIICIGFWLNAAAYAIYRLDNQIKGYPVMFFYFYNSALSVCHFIYTPFVILQIFIMQLPYLEIETKFYPELLAGLIMTLSVSGITALVGFIRLVIYTYTNRESSEPYEEI